MEKCNVMFILVHDACRQMCVSFLHLFLKHSAFQLPGYLISSLVKTFLEYRRIQSKKYITDYRTANAIQLIVAIKGDFLVYSFLNKSQQMEFLQKLVDEFSHLFICKSIRQTFRCHSKWPLLQYFTLDGFFYRRFSHYEQFC